MIESEYEYDGNMIMTSTCDNNNGGESDEHHPPRISISSNEALRLIQKMERLGFVELATNKDVITKRRSKNSSSTACEILIVECNIFELEPTLVTMNHLVTLLENQLIEQGGRMTFPLSSPIPSSIETHPVEYPTNKLLCSLLTQAAYHPFLIRAAETLCESVQLSGRNSSEHLFPRIQLLKDVQRCELLSYEYMEDIMKQIFRRFEHDETLERVLIHEIAKSTFQLPVDFLYSSIQKFLRNKEKYVLNQGGKDGIKQLLAPSYIHRRKKEIYEALSNLQEPTTLDLKWFHAFEWDVGSIVKFIKSSGFNHTADYMTDNPTPLEGDFHASFDVNYVNGQAMFIPHSHLRMQRGKILEFYNLHGYISFNQCLTWGISRSRIKDVLLEALPTSIHLSNSCVNELVIISPIQANLVDCVNKGSYLDLDPLLPLEFVTEELFYQDIQSIVMIALKNYEEYKGKDTKRYGTLLMTNGHAIYYTSTFVTSVEDMVLSSCITTFAKRRAEQLSKTKKSILKETMECSSESSFSDIISVQEIVSKLSETYPDLGELQNCQPVEKRSDDGKWPSLEDDDESDSMISGPLVALCMLLNKQKIIDSCKIVVQVELERMIAFKQGSPVDGLDKALKLKSDLSAFEDFFPTSCHFMQLLAKLPLACEKTSIGSNHGGSFIYAFLRGPAIDFIMRLTQFCVHKHRLTSVFKFKDPETNQTCNRIDLYASPVNLCVRYFQPWSLSCQHDAQLSDPYKVLRDTLPQGVGDALASMWLLTESRDHLVSDPSIIADFMSLVVENCLLICGMPFKLIDKKIEKQLLSLRMSNLLAILEQSTDPLEISDLIVMILSQQLLGFVVCPRPQTNDLMQMLLSNKKIPSELAMKLKMIFCHNQKSTTEADYLLSEVKDVVLSKGVKGVLKGFK